MGTLARPQQEDTMRISGLALAALLAPALAAPSLAANGGPFDAAAPWRDRMMACVALWDGASVEERGAMTYRQFTAKCVEGKTALPIKTKAACRDGTTSLATASGGACAERGGISAWME